MAALLVLLAGCARLGIGPGASSTAPSANDLAGTWLLDSGYGPSGQVEVPDGWRVTLVFDDSGVHGQACNMYGGSYQLTGSTIGFSEMSMTEMACQEPMMTVESAYHAALGAVDTFARTGDQLTLGGNGAELVFSLQPPVPDATLQGTRWLLETLLQGETASSVQGLGWLELGADGALTGSTGCRELSGTYVLSGDQVVISDLRATGACDAALAQQDAHVVSVIEGGFTVAIDGAKLTIISQGGDGLGYRAPGPD
jgi:heat shock protein HslJ